MFCVPLMFFQGHFSRVYEEIIMKNFILFFVIFVLVSIGLDFLRSGVISSLGLFYSVIAAIVAAGIFSFVAKKR